MNTAIICRWSAMKAECGTGTSEIIRRCRGSRAGCDHSDFAGDTPAATELLRLLAQQMVRVREQLGNRFRFSRVVIATDLTMSIYEHYSRAVHRNSLRIAAIRHGKFEAVMRKF